MKKNEEKSGPDPLGGLDKIDSLSRDELIAADRRPGRGYLLMMWAFFVFSLLDIYCRGCKTRRLLDSLDFLQAGKEVDPKTRRQLNDREENSGQKSIKHKGLTAGL